MERRRRILPYIFATVVLLVAIAPQLAYAEEDPGVQYAKNLGGIGQEEFTGAAATLDGGTVLVGYSGGTSTNLDTKNWGNEGGFDGVIVKLDADGDVEWAKNLGGPFDDYFQSVAILSDGGIVVVGISFGVSTNLGSGNWANEGSGDAIIVELDADGTVQWSKNLGGAESEGFYAVTALSDGSTVAVGNSFGASTNLTNNRANEDGQDAIVVKMDTDGNVLWSNNLGGENWDHFSAVTVLSDGSIVAAGYSDGASTNLGINNWANQGGNDAIIVKLDANGDVDWSNNLGGVSSESFSSVVVMPDGSIVAVGESSGASTNLDTNNWANEGNYDAIVVKLDTAGTVKWTKNLGGADNEYFRATSSLADGSIVVVGFSSGVSTNLGTSNWANGGFSDAIIVKLDGDGDVDWSKNLGGASRESFASVVVMLDGSIVAAGQSLGASTNLGVNNWGNVGFYDIIAVRLNLAYTLTINDGKGGSTNQTVYSGQKLTAPTTPIRDGYTFTGWFTEAGLTTKWDFTTGTVTGNITLYAGWQADEVTPTPTPTITPGPTAPPTGDAGNDSGWMWMMILAAGMLGIYIAIRRVKERE